MGINRNSTSIDSISCLSVNETVVMEMVYGAAYVLKALYTPQLYWANYLREIGGISDFAI